MPAFNAQNKSLADRLRDRISVDGPINFRDWMQAALYDEQDGYYARTDLIRQGRAGDYRTAPETSRLFAETFARYFIKAYFDLGAPRRWTIIEAGGGAGLFARGVLHSLRLNSPSIFEVTHYLIDETSAASRARAVANLDEFNDRVEFQNLGEISQPFAHALIFSNELIDAFPVHRVIGRRETLKELQVSTDEHGHFIWIECDMDADLAEYCQRIGLQLAEGQIFEVNLDADRFVARAASLIEQGFLITVDYGATRNELLTAPNRFKGTLRAFRRHQLIDNVLSNPGAQDLTTTVDWTQMQDSGARHDFENLRLERLDLFLLSEGIVEALANAEQSGDPIDLINLRTGAREMILPTGMAAAFQVLIQRKNR